MPGISSAVIADDRVRVARQPGVPLSLPKPTATGARMPDATGIIAEHASDDFTCTSKEESQ